jgi:capsular polysaccharide biosynthesis protein
MHDEEFSRPIHPVQHALQIVKDYASIVKANRMVEDMSVMKSFLSDENPLRVVG